MNTLNVLVAVAALILFPIGVATFMLLWVQASDEDKMKWKKLRAICTEKITRILTYAGTLVLVIRGGLGIVAFAITDDPLTRSSVLHLLLDCWSIVVFAATGLGLAVIWRKMDEAQRNQQS
ncbi:hypothetical protein SAMN04490185_4189 [Pseudomonas frederiksbergensis]|uniref:Uncharacterized protein n=1 Tax=Pseudomonas frederiksbergensis TaxID=104087 RepID=A0A1H5DII7_9PSED|nr:hypothetical protein [Pseudomonas frederiksbergensis]SED78646.1 hypothetical protein SAMN04490185_4189 [Pseudomonas frederiksbergensis]